MAYQLPTQPRTTLYTVRSGLPSLLKARLSGEAHAYLEPRITALGVAAASRGIELGDTADREGPVHVPFDALGNRVDVFRHHPAYLELEKMSYGAGLVAMKYDPENRRRFTGNLHQMGFAMTLVFGGAESGMLCPLCMTDGAARVLEAHASAAIKARALPRLTKRLEPHRRQRCTSANCACAMWWWTFMTRRLPARAAGRTVCAWMR